MLINKIKNRISSILFYNRLKKCGISIGKYVFIDNKCKFDCYANIAHHAELNNVFVGKRTSIGRYTKIRDTKIGAYCSISWDCSIGAISHHVDRLSSHAFVFLKKFGIVEKDCDDRVIKKTCIGNDVWIGCNVIILSGVNIGDGAIIGAGTIVTKDVAPYSIVVGSPARVIKYRFNENIRKKLSELRWWDFDDEILKKNIKLFQSFLDEEKVDELLKYKNCILKKYK